MKITHLKVDNFRETRTIDLRNLTMTTILTGPNGAGKTTALDAIRVCLTGQCYDQSGKRIPNEDLIGPHGKAATIDMGVEVADKAFSLFLTIKKGGITLTAKDARAYEAFPGADGATKIRAALIAAMGTDAARVECALNPRAYLLGPELGNILAELCGGSVDINDVRNAAGENWEYLERLASDMSLDFDAASLPKIGEGAYKRRTEVNKHIAVLEKTIADREATEQPVDTKGNPMEADQLQPLTKLLSELQAKRDGLIAERGKLESIGSAESVKAAREGIESALSTARMNFAANDQIATKAASNYREIDGAFVAASKSLLSIRNLYAIASGRANAAKDAIAALACDEPTCPTCGRDYDESIRLRIMGPLESELASAEKDRDSINLADAETKLQEFGTAADTAKTELDKAREDLRTSEVALVQLERDLAAMPDPAVMKSAEQVNAEIATIEGRCESGKQKLEALGLWVERIAAERSIAELYEEHAHLEWVIMAFKDGEFMKSSLSGSKGEFETACNATLAPYGYAMAVEVDGKHVMVTLAKEGHRPAPIAQCSKAELVLAGWAVASAFAGQAPVCIDDMDALYGKTKNILLKSLAGRECESPVFIAGAWTAGNVDLDPIRAALPNASVVWVENGEAKTQGAKVAA